MANDKFTPTENFGQGHIVGGYASDDNTTQLVLRLDPTTKRLLVSTTIESYTAVTDGEAVDIATTGTLILGTDGANYQVLSTDNSGKLQVTFSNTTIAVTNAGTFQVQATLDAETTKVIGTIRVASGGIASGALASGSIASGAIAAGAIASGAAVSGAFADGALVTLGAKADAKSTATDTTAVTIMSVLKQISASVQAPPSQAVTNTGTFAVQAAITAASGSIASGAIASGAIASGAIAAGAIASGAAVSGAFADGALVTLGTKADAKNSATDTTSITIMSVLKQISASVQAPPSQAVTNAGTFAVQAAGDVASGSSDSGNPLKIGGVAKSSEPTAVTTGQRVNAMFDLVGKQIVLPYANPENFVSGRASATDTTSTSLLAAPAAGLRNYITQITVWNSSAVSTYVKIQDGSGGTELYDIPAPAGGGATLAFPTPLRQPTTATAIYFAAAAVANAIVISASGYKGA